MFRLKGEANIFIKCSSAMWLPMLELTMILVFSFRILVLTVTMKLSLLVEFSLIIVVSVNSLYIHSISLQVRTSESKRNWGRPWQAIWRLLAILSAFLFYLLFLVIIHRWLRGLTSIHSGRLYRLQPSWRRSISINHRNLSPIDQDKL